MPRKIIDSLTDSKLSDKMKYYYRHPERHSKNIPSIRRKCLYGITEKEYKSLLKIQENKCAICHQEFGKLFTNRPQIDHNHKTEKTRGLLCNSCNLILGYSKENPTILKSAIRYLSRNGRKKNESEDR